MIARALAVFFAMVVLDVAFAFYIVEAAALRPVSAGAWAAAIQLCNVFVVTSFVKDPRMTLPCAAGAFVGTWVALEVARLL